MYYLDEKGIRVYTLKVRRAWTRRTSMASKVFAQLAKDEQKPSHFMPRPSLTSFPVLSLIAEIRARRQPHAVRAPRALLPRRQVLQATRGVQEEVRAVAHAETHSRAVGGRWLNSLE